MDYKTFTKFTLRKHSRRKYMKMK